MSAKRQRQTIHEMWGAVFSAELFVCQITNHGSQPIKGVCPKAMLREMQVYRDAMLAAIGEEN